MSSLLDMDLIDEGPGYWDAYATRLENNYDSDMVVRENMAPKKMVELILPYLDKGRPILDIGTGTGHVGGELEGFVVDGIDFSFEMLRKAKNRGYRYLTRADMTFPPLKQDYYHALICVGVFDEAIDLWDFEILLKEVNVEVMGFAGYSAFFRSTYVIDSFRQRGFKEIKKKTDFAYFEDYEGKIPVNYTYLVAKR